jgi:hypothetical protein
MSLDTTLQMYLKNDPWFVPRRVAWEIINRGNHAIGLNKPKLLNLQAILDNMCDYGATGWQYEPGAITTADNVLRGNITVTDCKSLADIFLELVRHIPFVNLGQIQARHIERLNHRIVTRRGLVTFNGRTGSRSLEGRWCFGDHWVVEVDGLCYDPTFRLSNFSFGNPPQIDWYALDQVEDGVFTRTKWTHPNHRPVYITANGEYTFDRLQARTGVTAAAKRSVLSVFRR